jgi:hypothetical protein
MQLVIDRCGQVSCIYGEEIDLTALGSVSISRASHVEPDAAGTWWADLAPVGGPRLGPFDRRTQALAAERTWLERNWLTQVRVLPT